MPTKDKNSFITKPKVPFTGLLNLHWARKCLTDAKMENDNLKESQFTMKIKDSMGECSITIYTGS